MTVASTTEPAIGQFPPPQRRTWPAALALAEGSVALLSLAFAPVSQFYLAWLGLAPFFVLCARQSSNRRAFAWGWITGLLFFAVNMWWLCYVTVPGSAALMVYLALFWGLSAMAARALLQRPDSTLPAFTASVITTANVVILALLWTAFEWLRGNYSMFGNEGLPWLYLGYTQSPALIVCQIADWTGVLGVSFLIALVNGVIALAWIRRAIAGLAAPIVVVGLLLAGDLAYGGYRLQTTHTRPGPTVVVVQPNYPQDNSGSKGAPQDEIVRFHLSETQHALDECARRGIRVNLIVWSETMMPPLNEESRRYIRDVLNSSFDEQVATALADLAREAHAGLLVGSTFGDGWHLLPNGDPFPTDHRNSAYFFLPDGSLSPRRYDKIRLLPFGEFIPFKEQLPWLYRILVALGPPDMASYELTAGKADAMTVFSLPATSEKTQADRFVVPICFEDIVPGLVARMIDGGATGKRADFIVNITNDGWFGAAEHWQHLQAAVFRSIENRVPTARSVNTGVSGFVDTLGHTFDLVPGNTEGWSVHTLQLDDRRTFYTRHGDWFAHGCVIVLAIAVAVWIVRRRRNPG